MTNEMCKCGHEEWHHSGQKNNTFCAHSINGTCPCKKFQPQKFDAIDNIRKALNTKNEFGETNREQFLKLEEAHNKSIERLKAEVEKILDDWYMKKTNKCKEKELLDLGVVRDGIINNFDWEELKKRLFSG